MTDKINLFGRSHSCIGNTDSDFIIRTRGLVRIQIGKIFLDLIKDGKINSGSTFKIHEVESEDQVGSYGDGFYLVGDKLYLSYNGKTYQLSGGDLYVSYQEQTPTVEEQEQAQKNIGILVENRDEIPEGYNGIVFVKSDNKLYQVKDGEVQELNITVEIPNPYTKQLVFQVPVGQYDGSIRINGRGDSTGINFDGVSDIYQDERLIIDSTTGTIIKYNNVDKIRVYSDITVTADTTFEKDVISNMFKSPGATVNSGFRLYNEKGQTTLEVDNLIVRNQTNKLTYKQLLYKIDNEELIKGNTYIIIDFQNKWELDVLANQVWEDTYDSRGEQLISSKNTIWLQVTATSSNTISKDVIDVDHTQWKLEYDLQKNLYSYNDHYNKEGASRDDVDNWEWCDGAYTYIGSAIGRGKVQDRNDLNYEPKGEITKLTDEYGNSLPYYFKSLQFYTKDLDGKYKWLWTIQDSKGVEGSDKVKNFKVDLFNYQMSSKKYVDDEGYDPADISKQQYWLNINKGLYCLSFKSLACSNNHFAHIDQDLIIAPIDFTGNEFTSTIRGVKFGPVDKKDPTKITVVVRQNTFYGVLDTVEFKCGLYYNEFQGLNHVTFDVPDDGKVYNMTNNKFHADVAQMTFNTTDVQQAKLYDDIKACDVYKNWILEDGKKVEILRIICIPDYATKADDGRVQIGDNINVTPKGIISVPIATKDSLGVVQPGDGVDIDSNGVISVKTQEGDTKIPPATGDTIGGVIIGDNITVDKDGKISVPIATKDILGVIKVGSGLAITKDGTLSATSTGGGGITTIPIATTTTLGAIIVGDGLKINSDGVLSIIPAQQQGIPLASKTNVGAVQIGKGLDINNKGLLDAHIASKVELGSIMVGEGLTVSDEGAVSVIGRKGGQKTIGDFVFDVDDTNNVYIFNATRSGNLSPTLTQGVNSCDIFIDVTNTGSNPIMVGLYGNNTKNSALAALARSENAVFRYTVDSSGRSYAQSLYKDPDFILGTAANPTVLFSGIVSRDTSNINDNVKTNKFVNYKKSSWSFTFEIALEGLSYNVDVWPTSVSATIQSAADIDVTNTAGDSYNGDRTRGNGAPWLYAGINQYKTIILKAAGQYNNGNDSWGAAIDRINKFNITIYGYVTIN